MNKVLVSYFSASGVTKNIAKKIKEVVEGDLFEIEPVEKYSSADLDWMDKNSRSTIEMNDRNYRPPIKNKIENIDKYDKIVIGFPIWWYTAPTIINTFIEENNLENKKIYVFCTSGGSGIEESLNDLKSKYSNLDFVNGIRFSSNPDRDEILSWIK